MIHVRTLGTAEVLVGEHRIAPDSAMLFALALFLSVSAGQRVHRSRLIDLLWPEAPDGGRRHALRQLLYRLRSRGFPLSLDGEELVLAEDEVESDIRRVLASRWPEEARPEEVLAAASVLPGYDPPMPELYREWLDELRSRVSSQYRRAALRQIDAARRDGRWHDVDDWARRCLGVDPLNEEATLAHAEAIAMSGSKARALQILDAYLNELGDRDRVIGLPAKVLRRRVSESAPVRARGEAESVPLIGREQEVAQLVDTLTGTLSGRGAALFIEGAAGIGKSRLARELLTTAAMRGWRTVSTQLHAGDVQRPLGVFVDLFGALLQIPGALGCSPASLSQLRLLTEHEVRTGAETQRSQEAEAVQERLRNAARDLIESVVSEGPLVIVIDDLHWCDEASIRLLQHLVFSSANLPVMWALTARHEGRYASLREAMSDLRVTTMQVSPLTADNANRLFEALADGAGQSRSVAASELPSAVTGGNPLFVLELARHVRETGHASSLPKSLHALIRDRAARLSPIAQHVLHTCAVLGRYSSVSRVSAVLEINTSDLLACIDELDALGIVGAGRDAEALSIHELWREELLIELPAASKKLLRYRCGLVLEGECRLSRSPSMVWEAAQHLLASGSEGRALSLLEECAQHQLDNGLPAEAANSFDLAFQASTTDVDRLRALTGRIAALKRAADWIQISAIVESAIDLSVRSSLQTSPHTDLELLQTEVMWRTESDLGSSLDRSLGCALDESASTAHRAEAALLAAIVADNTCRFADLERLNGIASELVASTVDARANVMSVRLIYETILGSLDRASEYGTELVELERGAGSVRGLARALRFSCHPHRMLGEFDRALASLHEALELAERHHLVGEAASAADIILSIHLERLNLGAASSWIGRSERLASRVGARYARVSLAINQAIHALLLCDPMCAMRFIEPYAQNHLADPIIRQRMLLLSILARIFVARLDCERLAELAPSLKSALDLRRSTGAHDFHIASYAHALEALGNRRDAAEYVREFVRAGRRDRTRPSAELAVFLQE
jgi:DNA-binding SARP family transcriptional activator/tetratricopeptide (TPR) repeat protein